MFQPATTTQIGLIAYWMTIAAIMRNVIHALISIVLIMMEMNMHAYQMDKIVIGIIPQNYVQLEQHHVEI